MTPQPLEVVDRAGCDLSPVAANTPDGSHLLTSFVWPFDLHRHERLSAALTLAQRYPVRVDPASAAEWLPGELTSQPAEPETLTVIWHSVTQLYWPVAEVAAVGDVLAEHGARRRLGRVSMEYEREAVEEGGSLSRTPVVRTSLWQPGRPGPRNRLLGSAHDHGPPVRLLAEPASRSWP